MQLWSIAHAFHPRVDPIRPHSIHPTEVMGVSLFFSANICSKTMQGGSNCCARRLGHVRVSPKQASVRIVVGRWEFTVFLFLRATLEDCGSTTAVLALFSGENRSWLGCKGESSHSSNFEILPEGVTITDEKRTTVVTLACVHSTSSDDRIFIHIFLANLSFSHVDIAHVEGKLLGSRWGPKLPNYLKPSLTLTKTTILHGLFVLKVPSPKAVRGMNSWAVLAHPWFYIKLNALNLGSLNPTP